jgi:hypothetical protein
LFVFPLEKETNTPNTEEKWQFLLGAVTTLVSNIQLRRVAASVTTLNVSENVPKKRAVIVERCAVTDAMRFGIVRLNADVRTGRVRTNVRASRFDHDPRP